jgi:hypothetical protein
MDLVLVHSSTQSPGGWDRLVEQLAYLTDTLG